MHILSKLLDNCLSWITGKGRTTASKISMTINGSKFSHFSHKISRGNHFLTTVNGGNSTENWRKMLNYNPKRYIVNIILYVKLERNHRFFHKILSGNQFMTAVKDNESAGKCWLAIPSGVFSISFYMLDSIKFNHFLLMMLRENLCYGWADWRADRRMGQTTLKLYTRYLFVCWRGECV